MNRNLERSKPAFEQTLRDLAQPFLVFERTSTVSKVSWSTRVPPKIYYRIPPAGGFSPDLGGFRSGPGFIAVQNTD
jgi:hypothetical protein